MNHIPGVGEQPRQKRPYQKKKQRHKSSQSRQHQTLAGYGQVGGSSGGQHKFDPMFGTSLGPLSSDDEGLGGGPDSAASPSDMEEELEEGPYAFRRKRHCQYLAPLVDEDGFEKIRGWPWEGREEGGGAEPKYGYSLASLSNPKRCLGMVRRRVGRGGRIILDRAFSTNHDDFWRSLDFTVLSGVGGGGGDRKRDLADERTSRLFEDWPHYRPVTPPLCQEEPDYDPYFGDNKPSLLPSSSALPVNLGGLLPTAPVKLTPPSSASKMSAVTASNSASVAGSSNSRPQVVITPTGLRTVSVDSVVAHNAASAVVNSDTIDLFQTQQQQQQQQQSA